MKRLWIYVMLAAALSPARPSMSQAGHFRAGVILELHGSVLKWLVAADRELVRRKLIVEQYDVSVYEERDSVTVIFRAPDPAPDVPSRHRGDMPGGPRGLQVEVRKSDGAVLRSYYIK